MKRFLAQVENSQLVRYAALVQSVPVPVQGVIGNIIQWLQNHGVAFADILSFLENNLPLLIKIAPIVGNDIPLLIKIISGTDPTVASDVLALIQSLSGLFGKKAA